MRAMHDNCPLHPDSPQADAVTRLCFDIDPETQQVTSLSATLLNRRGESRTYQFSGVQLRNGGSIALPNPLGSSFAIYDITSRQWDGLNLAVKFATSYSEAESFWAKSVSVVRDE